MKISFSTKRAMTLIEVIVVIAIVGMLIGIFLPSLHHGGRTRAPRIACLSNLKQVGMGFHLYANDGAAYPSFYPTNEAWTYFQVVGKELGSPKILLCPTDPTRTQAALDFELAGISNSFAHPSFQNNALSFFYGTEAEKSNPGAILAGDRNLSRTGPMMRGVLTLKTNSPVAWTKDLHQGEGNVVLADGSAQMLNTTKLRQQLPQTTNNFVRFVLP